MASSNTPSMRIVVHTDGSCSGNPGPGGWGAIVSIRDDNITVERVQLSGAESDTTNIRMEMSAALSALLYVRDRPDFDPATPISIHSDCKLVVDGFMVWLPNWLKNGWRTADKKPVKNQDLWKRIVAATEGLSTSFAWVRGHSGNIENEAADALARFAMDRFRAAA